MSKPKRYSIHLTDEAETDLATIYDYFLGKGLDDTAERLLVRLIDKAESLREFPERGPVPNELADLGIHEFRQLMMLPYRLIYSIDGNRVNVVLIADGRRDMELLLRERLLAT